MNGFRKIFPTFLSHYATFFAKMAQRKVVPFDEFATDRRPFLPPSQNGRALVDFLLFDDETHCVVLFSPFF
jgi:hypothetical protein